MIGVVPMRLYVLEKDKLHKFDLPPVIEGSFLFSYKQGSLEKIINIEAVDNTWQLISNGNIDVVSNGIAQPGTVLREYNHYSLQTIGEKELISAYVYPSLEKEHIKLSTMGLNTITVGKSGATNIVYKNDFLLDIHTSFNLENNVWYLVRGQDEKCLVYLNDKRVIKNEKLHIGDIIFIHGLKIIWKELYLIL